MPKDDESTAKDIAKVGAGVFLGKVAHDVLVETPRKEREAAQRQRAIEHEEYTRQQRHQNLLDDLDKRNEDFDREQHELKQTEEAKTTACYKFLVETYPDDYKKHLADVKNRAENKDIDMNSAVDRQYSEEEVYSLFNDEQHGRARKYVERQAAKAQEKEIERRKEIEIEKEIEKAEKSAKAITEMRQQAEQGIAEAQFNLGWAYWTGDGVAEDRVEAVPWFHKAAEQGDATAQYNLGVAYANGDGVAEDKVAAVSWYRKAAEQGYADAQNNLGVAYDNGEGIAKDKVAAVKWYRKAAKQGVALAQNNLEVAELALQKKGCLTLIGTIIGLIILLWIFW